jgi:hypothetical protein
MVQTNGPDAEVKSSIEQARAGTLQQPEVVQYGQR